MIDNNWHKKEKPMLTMGGMGGGAFQQVLLSSGVTLGNRSLRFNPADSPTLSKTFASAGDRRTWTFSCWVKRTTSFNSYRHTLASGNGFTLSFSETAQGGPDEWFFYVDGTPYLLSNAKLRDTSAWYHVVFVFDTTNSTEADRCRVYQNGERITSWRNTAYPSQNFEGSFNTAITHKIGCGNANEFLDGYMTDVYFIDGQALNPTSFGAADSNGVWQRSTYSGSYGTNGFHILDFANDETIGNDTSGNGNHFTASNFNETEGSGNDVLFDFPTNDTENTDSGAGGEVIGNYCVFNSLHKGNDVTLSNGNLQAATTSSPKDGVFGSIGVSSGKYYWEVELTSADGNTNAAIGVALGSLSPDAATPTSAGAYFYSSYNGNKWLSNADSSYGASYTTGDIIGVALDLDNSTLAFYKNGVSQGNATTSLPSGTYFPYVGDNANNAAQTVVANWGQREFSYSAPTNHKCLTTTSLPTPAIADGSDYFDIDTYTGNATTHERSEFSFSPDLVWIKSRVAGNWHQWFDIIRGAQKRIYSNRTESEATASGSLDSFDSDGFTLGSDGALNANGSTYVAWAWDAGSSTVTNNAGSIETQVRANQTAGFSIATYSYNNSLGSQTLGHGLGAIPDLVIRKDRNLGEDWSVYSKDMGFTQRAHLNTTAAFSGTTTFGSASATSTVNRANNMNNGNYVDYSFVSIPGYSSIGTYVGNGNADGPFVNCGFKPAFIMIKGASSGGTNYNWALVDTARSYANVANHTLAANLANAESYYGNGASVFGPNNKIDILSNGFKPRENATFHNTSGVTYIYYAVAENPFQANGGIAR